MSRAGRGRPRQPLKARNSPRLTAWRQSARCRRVALQALEIAHAVRASLPKCGAKRKRDGQPCQQLALKNGRCKFHGGRTPSGDGWHRPRVPSRGEVNGVEKFEKKLETAEKRRAGRRQRLAAMPPDERDRYLRWEASRAPGPASGRAHKRRQLETKAMLDRLLAEADARRAAEEEREFAIRAEASRDRTRLQVQPPAPDEDPPEEHVDVFA